VRATLGGVPGTDRPAAVDLAGPALRPAAGPPSCARACRKAQAQAEDADLLARGARWAWACNPCGEEVWTPADLMYNIVWRVGRVAAVGACAG